MAQGEIECIKESLDGRSLSIVTLTPPEVFWGLAFFHEHARLPVSLKTNEDTRLILWRRDDLMPILKRNGEAL